MTRFSAITFRQLELEWTIGNVCWADLVAHRTVIILHMIPSENLYNTEKKNEET